MKDPDTLTKGLRRQIGGVKKAPYRDNRAAGDIKLRDEAQLERAESTLDDWATALAEAGRDFDAAEALRVRAALLSFRCGFLFKEKE